MLATALLLAAETHGEEGAKETVNPILPTGSEIFWAVVTFFLLWMLLRYVFLPPVMRLMEEREERLREARAAAEGATAGADDAVAAYDARVNEARAEANAIVTAARDEVEAYRAQKLAEANADVAALREQAAAEVAQAKAAALQQLRSQVAGVAVNAASRVVQKDLALDAQLQVIEDYVNQANGGGPR
ncbi:MAG: F0F1 ATP synthase subunit B [Acidimicrobiia bacterium]